MISGNGMLELVYQSIIYVESCVYRWSKQYSSSLSAEPCQYAPISLSSFGKLRPRRSLSESCEKAARQWRTPSISNTPTSEPELSSDNGFTVLDTAGGWLDDDWDIMSGRTGILLYVDCRCACLWSRPESRLLMNMLSINVLQVL